MNGLIRILCNLFFMAIILVPAHGWGQEEDSFNEGEIESDEALADSDAAVAEKKELKKIRADEKKRAAQEKKLSEQAKIKAKQAAAQAEKESVRVEKEARKYRADRQYFEGLKKKANNAENKIRQKIETAKRVEEKARQEFEESKRAKEEAEFNLKQAKDLQTELVKKIAKEKADREYLWKKTQMLKTRTAEINAQTKALARREKASVSNPVGAPAGTTNRSKFNGTKMPDTKYLVRDCNLRQGPSGNSPSFGPLLKGAKVMVYGLAGAWYSVSTSTIDKAYLAKPCL